MPLPPDFEKTLWASADQLWANTGLQPADYDGRRHPERW